MAKETLDEIISKLREVGEFLSEAINVLETSKKLKFFDALFGGFFVGVGAATLPARYRKALIYVLKAQESLNNMFKLLEEVSEETYNMVLSALQEIRNLDLNQIMLILSKEWPENEIIQQIGNKIQIIENTIKNLEKTNLKNDQF